MSPLDGRTDHLVAFFPQWEGIPDDAGGYIYSPRVVPVGTEMYGTQCLDPEDLGDGWGTCSPP